METLKGSKTEQNLVKAWYLETANIRLYEIFAKQAKKDGFEQISAIFIEVAEQKRSHTKTIYRFLQDSHVETVSTFSARKFDNIQDCLRAASELELKESTILFEEFERIAWEDGFKQIATKFKLFRRIKQFYQERFAIFLSNIEQGKVFKRDKKVKWICRKCGLIYESDRALKNCPGCEHPQAYFEILAENY